jgi:very-short-patch-repair endonuclease/uncharacterized protein (DUF1810 family)
MTSPLDRLIQLIEYAKESAKLKANPPMQVTQHKQFVRFEERMKGLPGLAFNCRDEFDEVWLRLDRQHENRPPAPEDEFLKLWLDLSSNPMREPALKTQVERKALESAEPEHLKSKAVERVGENREEVAKPLSQDVLLASYSHKDVLEAALKAYKTLHWEQWATTEKEIRKSISLYSDLFMLAQQLQGNLLDSHLELVWGQGVAIWNSPAGLVTYPLLTQLVEIALNEQSMSLEIRPRSTEPQLELDVYAAMDNPGVAPLSVAAKDFFKTSDGILNPFEASSYEGLLKSAVTRLDSAGLYWPDQTTADDRSLPKATEHLVVTDTWVLFARPRTASLFVQDLLRFEKALESNSEIVLPGAVAAIVSDPSNESNEVTLPSFRGLSPVTGNGDSDDSAEKPRELFFPMPYNDEQVHTVQLLEAHDGVVVQGPPGTGKTHTIANIICHYLALGKRVLVTSMKDPALAVLQEKLPDPIKPLAVSLLTSEAEGMKQFEFSISKIASELHRIDKTTYRREIEQIEGQIDSLHGKISRTDKEISVWAKRNLEKIVIDGEELSPVEAAEAVTLNRNQIVWFPDAIGIGQEHVAQFSNESVIALRAARRALGKDLAYLDKALPQIADFPATARLLQVHHDLTMLSELKSKEATGSVPSLSNTTPETIKLAILAVEKTSAVRSLLQELERAHQTWIAGLVRILRHNNQEIRDLFLALRKDILAALDERRQFLAKPVATPEAIEANTQMVEAVRNLSQDKKPFGLAGLFGKGEQKKLLDSIQVVGASPANRDDWKHVSKWLNFQATCKALLVRWNTLADEMSLPHFDVKPERVSGVGLAIDLFDKAQSFLDGEAELVEMFKRLIPAWSGVAMTPYTLASLTEAESILAHHLTRHRLADTWVLKESFSKALSGKEGAITDQLWHFMNSQLGHPEFSETNIQTNWSGLMEELRRVHSLAPHLRTVQEMTHKICLSGGINWAKQLQTLPALEPHDGLLPDNWKEVWRLARLVNFVDSIDARHELRRLTQLRSALEGDLAKQYRDAVSKRTWLRLKENSTDMVTKALEAYRIAIKKIGKGTGIKAGRYRQDARLAAEGANAAIPCWIMPHYRICESLPAQLGVFDLVIIDEASQSDLTALPALLRAKKVLIVGDDKQVSPEGVGMEEEKIRALMARFLPGQVSLYRPQMAPDRSIYDLFKVVYANSAVMLREHFRCVAPIIEYSKREFYDHELRPLRMPKMSERLDPPLVDVHVTDGYRNKDINQPEARFIVDEIRRITENPAYSGRTIGVVSLLGSEQALYIMKLLTDELGEQVMTHYKITCGDARTFQGKERDIMFLSMLVSPGQAHAQGTEMFAQRFNVAASRARDRMYLVRSVTLDDLSQKDHLRIKLLQHFESPFLQDQEEVANLRDLCESPFEREVFDFLTERGYRVIPQVPVGSYRIDMVVEGDNDARLAIECDGDRYHGPGQWDADMRRQRILERAGWHFWRSFASTFVMHREDVVRDLLVTLETMDIHPTNGNGVVKSIHTELREVVAFPSQEKSEYVDDEKNPAAPIESKSPAPVEEAESPNETPPQIMSSSKLEVEEGDLVTYLPQGQSDEHVLTVCITHNKTDFEQGLIGANTPLAQALLGASIGDEVTLRVPGQAPKAFVITAIKKT